LASNSPLPSGTVHCNPGFLFEFQTFIETLSEQQKSEIQTLQQIVLKKRAFDEHNRPNDSLVNRQNPRQEVKPIISMPVLTIPKLTTRLSPLAASLLRGRRWPLS
jgi:hypothetical protein